MDRYDTLETDLRDGIGIIWLNRPDLRNAFNDAMVAELDRALRAMEADTVVRAVVLAARGPAFCAGADLNWMKQMAGYSLAQNRDDALGLASMLRTLNTLAKPTIARVHGHAFAGGVGLVAACDLAVASFDAQFCLSEVRLGLIPATISPYVIAAMGERAALRYTLTAERFTAAEAYRIGLVQEIAPADKLDEKLDELLTHLLLGGPAAHAAAKELVRAVARRPLDDALVADTAARIAAVRASPEGQEGIRSFLEKRRPGWLPGEPT